MKKDISYELLTNKLTEHGVCKFVSLYDIEELKCPSKKEMKEKIKELTGESRLFDSIPQKDFVDFYISTEEAGQKHFYFYNFEFDEKILNNIKNFIATCTSEDDREFDAAQEHKWFYNKEDDEIIVKLINIKEVYQHNKTLDIDESAKGRFFRGYNVFKIQNVLFIRFFISKNKVLIGIDKYSDLDTPSDIRSKIIDCFESVCGQKSANKLVGLIDTKVIENIIFMQNVISSKITNDINANKKSAMFAKKADMMKILEDVNNKKYTIEQVKERNPDFDIRTHPTYLAEQARKYEDSGMEIDINNCEIYWFTHWYKKADYFRFKISSIDSCITTYSSSITKKEFEDVIRQVI